MAIRLGGEATDALPRSLWAATAIPAPDTRPFTGTASVDVAVVGGGFLGLSAALHLAEAGLRPIVLEAAQPGWGASGRNNGQVIPGLKYDPDEVVARLGRERGERLVAWSGRAPDLVFALIEKHGIDCHPVRRGWIQPAYTRAALATIESRCAQWATRGADVAMLDRADLPARLGTPAFPGAWIDRRGGAVQPLSYARGLAHAAIRAGVPVHTATMVRSVDRSGGRWTVHCDGGTVTADRVVLATNAYGTLLPELRTAIVPVRTAQVATRPLSDNIRATILPDRQVASDTRNLLTSFRLSPDGRLVMGGSGATGGDEHDGLRTALHRSANELFGHLGTLEWEFFWSGHFALTDDHLPHIYEPAEGLLAGIGCNGRGIAVSTGVGKLIAERILGRAADDLDVPVRRLRPVAFHAFRNVGIAAATVYKGWKDRRERAGTV